jgi:DNA-binding transcriptional MerR regulator
MFRIGEFSRLGQVTIDTLRHYDTLGLLKPAKVDPFTGYRYYSAKQLQPLNRILALKELGFSLEEIARILQEELTDDQLRGMLKMQLVSAERDMQTVQSRLDRISARLKYLDMEEQMPAYEVTLKAVEPLTIASIREVVLEVAQMPERCEAMFNQIAKWMAANKLSFGPPMTRYFNEGYTNENIDTECSFIIMNPDTAELAPPDAPIIIQQLTAVPTMAATIATNDFYKQVGGLAPAYNALGRWIEDNQYQIVGPSRELFYGSPHQGDFTAEIQFPIEKL